MFLLRAVGVVHSPYRAREDAPRQGRFDEKESEIEIFGEYAEALEGIERCRYLFILWWADRAGRDLLKATPPGEEQERGVFATRSPARPNPICLSLVQLLLVQGNRLRVRWLDALDGTPVLDIKPYSPGIDSPENEGSPGSEEAPVHLDIRAGCGASRAPHR